MKKILVVGPNSYIAKNFVEFAGNKYNIDTLSVRDDAFLTFDYSGYDVIIYFAAIVHHPEITDEALYYKVNSEIPSKMASLAASQGVDRFVYISTVGVWGRGPKFAKENRITKDTPTTSGSLYGKSKLDGENKLNEIEDIKIAIVRLPNVYGDNCPGTFYHTIEKLSTLKVFPRYGRNKVMSLISVDNVAKALCRVIDNDLDGILVPQDSEIISIQDRIKKLSKGRQFQTSIFTPFIYIIGKLAPTKYTDNLYGGYLIDTNDFAPLTD